MTSTRDDARFELDPHELRDTLDSLREGVQILSPEWRYLYVNEAVARHGRKLREELLGRTMFECYPGIESTHAFSVLARCMRERQAETLETEFLYEDGQRAWFEVRIQPCREGLIVLSVDVTERKRLEAKVRQGEKLSALGQMAAGVAHDLRNILNPMALQVRLLRRHLTEGQTAADELLARIEDSIRTGSDTVESLRRFSRQEPDRAAEPIDLNRITDMAVEICLPRTRERADVEVRRERGEAPAVLVRPSGLVTAIVNFVMNALDAIPSQGAITVRTGSSDGGGWVEVADDGPGMSPEIKRRVFEPFFTTKSQGTGLGLAMAYAFVQRHGGRITLDTAPGRGTSIRMWFAAAASLEPRATPAGKRRDSAHRLLVAEDEPASRMALQTLLKEEGFVVDVASNGEEALARLATFDPEVLLVDLRMPGMDGVALMRRARAWKSQLPVVLMSGLDESQANVADLLRQPWTEHVVKPIDMDRLVAALERVLADSRGHVVGSA